jgi:uncharacterized protein involved in high-affinity Fe2+ transport
MTSGRVAVFQRWTGPMVVLLILGGVVLILALNLNLQRWKAAGRNPAGSASGPTLGFSASDVSAAPTATQRRPADFREYPIGEEVERHQMRIAAVWLPPVQMDGIVGPISSSLIHLEADIHATDGNRNGFAKDEFVPYLVVHYTIMPQDSAGPASAPPPGTMMPMVARDGLHYGANIELPKAGRYKLTYRIEPPSAGGLGRHADAATGVDPWWKPFEVAFDWDYPGPP